MDDTTNLSPTELQLFNKIRRLQQQIKEMEELFTTVDEKNTQENQSLRQQIKEKEEQIRNFENKLFEAKNPYSSRASPPPSFYPSSSPYRVKCLPSSSFNLSALAASPFSYQSPECFSPSFSEDSSSWQERYLSEKAEKTAWKAKYNKESKYVQSLKVIIKDLQTERYAQDEAYKKVCQDYEELYKIVCNQQREMEDMKSCTCNQSRMSLFDELEEVRKKVEAEFLEPFVDEEEDVFEQDIDKGDVFENEEEDVVKQIVGTILDRIIAEEEEFQQVNKESINPKICVAEEEELQQELPLLPSLPLIPSKSPSTFSEIKKTKSVPNLAKQSSCFSCSSGLLSGKSITDKKKQFGYSTQTIVSVSPVPLAAKIVELEEDFIEKIARSQSRRMDGQRSDAALLKQVSCNDFNANVVNDDLNNSQKDSRLKSIRIFVKKLSRKKSTKLSNENSSFPFSSTPIQNAGNPVPFNLSPLSGQQSNIFQSSLTIYSGHETSTVSSNPSISSYHFTASSGQLLKAKASLVSFEDVENLCYNDENEIPAVNEIQQ